MENIVVTEPNIETLVVAAPSEADVKNIDKMRIPTDEELDLLEDEEEDKETEDEASNFFSDDNLHMYFREMARYPILSMEEQVELAKRIELGDEEAKNYLVNCNLRLVIRVAKRYTGMGLDLQDLIQEGNIGLMRAASTYDWERGYAFSTYATWWIRQGCQRGVASMGRTVRLPQHMFDSVSKVKLATARLGQRLGRTPNIEELSKETGFTEEKVKSCIKFTQDTISLDSPISEDDGGKIGTFGENIVDERIKSPEQSCEETSLQEILSTILEGFPKKQREILILRFGLNGGRPHTLEEVGEIYGVTRERIRQIEAQAIRKLRNPKYARYLKDYVV